MKPISSSLTQIKARYNVVVIGSGYGGAVAASRLARAGQQICLLERGKEFLPGDFPNKISEAMPEFQVDMAGLHMGSHTGLYDMRINEDINVLVGCGLGGTSLINANVSLQAEKWVLEDDAWPANLRREFDNPNSPLHRGYDRAEAMLRPTTYPGANRKDQPLKKLAAQQRSAEGMDGIFELTPINVNFVDQEANHVGVKQKACNNCGDCISGCNVGAKNTTAMNYLPDAANHGAEIYCEVKVSHIERSGDKWRVYYQPQSLKRDVFDAPAMFVIADIVVLAAGALGSSEIMLRSRDKGLSISNQLGKGFTGNGDVLAFAYNCDQEINGIGFGDRNAEGREPVGPCITSVIDDRPNKGDQGMVIEEGSLPGLMEPLLSAIFSAAARVIGEDTDQGFLDTLKEKARIAESFFRGAFYGAIHNTQTFLVMSHDDGQGELILQDDRIRVDWPKVGLQPVFNRISDNLKKATAQLGGTYIRNPMWNKMLGHDLITVHPLGGCGMAESAEQGVVNDRCQVFSTSRGHAVYNGLYICDGSVIPRSLGVNPLLTITALSERACHLMAADKGWDENYSETSTAAGNNNQAKLGIQFTETMRGHIALDANLDFSAAESEGKQQDQTFVFTLTVSSDNLAALLEEKEHRAAMVGTVLAPALSSQPLMAVDGQFQLLVRDSNRVGRRLMDYRMQLVDENGRTYFFRGFKSVEDDKGLDIWSDTTTLFITLYDGETAQAAILGRGILHILPADFARQITTMKVRNAENKIEEIKAVARFGRYFAGSIAETYGGPLAHFTVYDVDTPPREKRPLRVCEPKYYPVTTDDGVEILLTRYCKPEGDAHRSAVMLVHGLGVSSRLYIHDTIETNFQQ